MARLSTGRRLACLVLALVAHVVLLAILSGCGLVQDALSAAGSAVSRGAADGVRQDVERVGGWVRDLVLLVVGAMTSEGGRYVHRARKRRREAKGSPRAPIVD